MKLLRPILGKNNTLASSMVQSEMLAPLLWFLHKAPYWHHRSTEGLLVTRGAKPPWAGEFASAENKSPADSPAREGCFLSSFWPQGQDSCCLCESKRQHGTLLRNSRFWLYIHPDKNRPHIPLTTARVMNSHQSHFQSEIWKTQLRAF